MGVQLPVEDINGVPHYRLRGLHYTRSSNVKGIKKNGFNVSSWGAYGPGVYATFPEGGDSFRFYSEQWVPEEQRAEIEIIAVVPVDDLYIVDERDYSEACTLARRARAVYVPASEILPADMAGQFRIRTQHIVETRVVRMEV